MELDVVMIQFVCIPRSYETNNLFDRLVEIRLRNGNHQNKYAKEEEEAKKGTGRTQEEPSHHPTPMRIYDDI
jgi:hypothetical protein